MAKAGFFYELKRRNVLRAGALYAAGAWLIVQVATQVFPFFHIAEWVVRWIVIAAVVGFPFVLAFSWFYELTPEGLKRDAEVAHDAAVTRAAGKRMDRLIIAVLALAVVLLLTNLFVGREAEHDAEPNAVAIPAKSIAVLPLVNEGGDANQQYFSDGLSEDLITTLSQFEGLKVIGRNSAFQFRDSKEDSRAIGAKLGVAHLLEGSVRRVEDAVRISAELVNTADGSTQWSRRFDRPYKDLFKLQDEITGAVATELEARLMVAPSGMLSDRPPSGNLDAYNAYLQGKFHLLRDNQTDFIASLDFFNRAIALDPNYAHAYAGLSVAQTYLASEFYGGDEAQKAYAAARQAADKALELAPGNAIAHNALGTYYLWTLDWANCEAEYRRALQLAPGNPIIEFNYARIAATFGRTREAIDDTRKALAQDALNAEALGFLANYLMYEGELDEAVKLARKAVDLQPVSTLENLALVNALILRGDLAAAHDAAARLPASGPSRWLLAFVEQTGADRAAADASLAALIDHDAAIVAYQIADVYALRKDPDKAFEWLDHAWANRDPGVSLLHYDAFFKPYRSDPRFAAFCRKVGLPTPDEIQRAASESSSVH